MLRYTIQRILFMLLTLFLIISITFTLLQFLPGSPFNDEKLTPEQREIVMEKYGLNDPLPVRYVRYMTGIFTGDFGRSFKFNKPVMDMIGDRLKMSAQVGLQALSFGAIMGIFLGAIAAINRNSFIDNFTTILAVMGIAVPVMVMGPLLQLFFGVKWQILPVIYTKNFVSTIMPTLALSFGTLASTARFMRTELIEVLNSDYILLAQAKGLSKPVVIFRHAIRNALIPVITIIGPAVVGLIGGSTVIERIFALPGLGNLMVTAIQTNDYFVILGEAIFYSGFFITVILIIDLLYGIIDPRIRLAGGNK